jgi:alpha-beta hydrolase superfamily lysophospholipase
MGKSGIVHDVFEIKNKSGDKIAGDIRRPVEKPLPAVIIIVHSFMAFKDWGFFPIIGEEFAGRGYTTVAFNFSHNGVAGNADRITDFLKFSKNTFSREVSDLQSVIDKIVDGRIVPGITNLSRLVLLGHSRGGGISIITASRDDRVNALITWSSIANFDRWTDHQKNQWRRQGYLQLSKHSEISPLKLCIDLLRDYEENTDALNILNAAQRIAVPWLIVHGKADVTVPVREGEALFNAAASRSVEFVPLEAVGHLYNAATRTEDNYETLESLIKITHNWLEKSIT